MGLRDLILRLRSLFAPARAERDLHDELSFHVERETQKLIDDGMPAAQARERANARFGSVTVVADQCRDERGTAFIDNTTSDIHYALRTFKRAPLAAATIVVTVAIGLGVVAVLFTIMNTMLFRIDNVPDINEIYAVERPRQSSELPSLLSLARYAALRSETHVFTDAYATLTERDLRVDGRVMAVSLVTGNFFQITAVHPAMGRALGPSDDEAGGNPVAVLSHKGWQRRFNGDPNVLGRTVMVYGAPFEIIGVMPEGFRGLEVSGPDFWAPLSQRAQFDPERRGGGDSIGVEIVGRLKPGISRESARAQLAAWESNQSAAPGAERALSIELVPRRGTIPQPLEAIAVFTPLFVVFGLILLIGCANVANLLLARGVARQKEIGVRLSLGASRSRIVRQLITENVLLALAAAAGGYVISRLALEGTVYWALRTMPVDLGDINLGVPAADWRVALFLVVSALAATAFFALLPALQATRVEPVRTIRGELIKEARPGRARNVLIGVQVFASALLLICAAIFLRSAIASARIDPGLRTADTVMIDSLNEPKRVAMLQALRTEPAIIAHAAVRPAMLAPPRRALAETGVGKTPLGYKFVSGGYFDVLGVAIVRGRSFTAAEVDDHPVAIVSESTARALWPNGDGVGETFRIEPDLAERDELTVLQINPEAAARGITPLTPRLVTVVGVARDVAGFRVTDIKNPDVFLPTRLETPSTSVVARIAGDPNLARQALFERLTRIDPNMNGIVTLRTVARMETFLLEIAFWVSTILGALALLLTVSGLFSVLSYLVEQRTREIGVRMALGATSQKVTRMLLAQTARPVIYGLLAGAVLAATLATVVLATPFGELIGEIVHVTDPVAYVSSLLVICAACLMAAWIPASRAARLDPMKTLRQD